MKRRNFVTALAMGGSMASVHASHSLMKIPYFNPQEIKLGIVGLSPHSAAFSGFLNDVQKSDDLKGCRISALYHPPGNPDVEFTAEQLADYKKSILSAGVKIVDSMEALLRESDGILIETNDGRPHLAEALPAMKAGLPVFVDKPVAASMAGVLEVYEAAEKFKVPIFSSSSLRYGKQPQLLNSNSPNQNVLGAQTFSSAPLQAAHTDLFWYGIHGVEMLFTVMGRGCKSVAHQYHSAIGDVVIGYWEDGRVGTFRGIREGKRGFGGTAFTKDSIVDLGGFEGYRPLVVRIVEFFNTNESPVSVAETLEIYAFMEAAQMSRKNGGQRVSLESMY
ncbi:Gfo/Idh/MocA family protein [Membranihabitans marinus]|uniref:Gfo/Idh/MocA family protein n=1 Tax=Membranihabitans marinus TaxID=1227546 RepID=UPI001F029598|nr:Gfo/Idh/MocA family oxidoreductase [Membranihabitans marinus]